MRFAVMLSLLVLATLAHSGLSYAHPGNTDALGCHRDTDDNSIHCREELKITNIRIGQGDATLTQGPVQDDCARVRVLIDAGHTQGFKTDSAVRVHLAKTVLVPLEWETPSGNGKIWTNRR